MARTLREGHPPLVRARCDLGQLISVTLPLCHQLPKNQCQPLNLLLLLHLFQNPTILDFILIGLGSFADDQGYLLLRWSVEEPSSSVAEASWNKAPSEPDVPGRRELVTRMDRINDELNDLQSIMTRIDSRLAPPRL
jgi:hypothetical protein